MIEPTNMDNGLFPRHLIVCKIADAMFIQNHRFCWTFLLTSILRFMTLQPQCWACQIPQSSPCLLGQNWSTAMPISHKPPLLMGLLGSIKKCRCWKYFALCYVFCSIVCMYNGIMYHFIPHLIHRYMLQSVLCSQSVQQPLSGNPFRVYQLAFATACLSVWNSSKFWFWVFEGWQSKAILNGSNPCWSNPLNRLKDIRAWYIDLTSGLTIPQKPIVTYYD